MNVSTLTTLTGGSSNDDTKRHRCLASSSSSSSSTSSTGLQQTTIGYPNDDESSFSSTLSLSFPSIGNRCESGGESVKSASSTTSNQSSEADCTVSNQVSFGLPTNYLYNPSTTISNLNSYHQTSNYFLQQQQQQQLEQQQQQHQRQSNGTTTSNLNSPLFSTTVPSVETSTSTSSTGGTPSSIDLNLLTSVNIASTSSSASSSAATALSSNEGSSSGANNPGSGPAADDHLSRLAQMTHGVGLVKSETESSDAAVANLAVAAATADAYQTAAAAAYAQAQAYGNWQNYYPFNNQMAPSAAAFPAWPGQCYPPAHWGNYAQTKKGRQTYQRYQTSVLESKFQQSSYVSKKQREELRLQTNLTDRQIKIWFQNRRMKAKKEKNRCDEQTDPQTLMPPSGQKSMMPGSNGSQLHHQNLGLIDDSLNLGIDQDKLKSGAPGNSMLGAQSSQMWCSPVNMNGGVPTTSMHGMPSMADMASWSMLPQTAHLQSHANAAVGSVPSHYTAMGYPICPPNL